MIIRELHIDSFQGLSERSFPLADGINVICGPNESGKSSLADFIFFMFYGIVTRADAQHFPSLETGKAAGSLLAELSDKERSRISVQLPRLVRIEREYIHRRRDSVRLLDGETYAELNIPRSPGETIFGISAPVMRSTSYVSQLGGHGVDGKDLGGAIENIMFAADESIDISKALARLDAARATLKHKNGGGGLIPTLREEHDKLLLERSRAEEGAEQISRLEGELGSCEEKCRASDERVERARGRVEYCELQAALLGASSADSLRERLASLDDEAAQTAAEAEYDGYYPDEEYIRRLRGLDSRISELRRSTGAATGGEQSDEETNGESGYDTRTRVNIPAAASRGTRSAAARNAASRSPRPDGQSPELLQLRAAVREAGGAEQLEHRIESSFTKKRIYLITSLILLAVFAFGVFCTAYLATEQGLSKMTLAAAGVSLCAMIVAAVTIGARRRAISEYYSLLMSTGAVDMLDLFRMLDELDRTGSYDGASDGTDGYDDADGYSEGGYGSDGNYDSDGGYNSEGCDSDDGESGKAGSAPAFDSRGVFVASDAETELYALEEELAAELARWGKASLSDAMSAYSKLNIRLGEIESERRHCTELLDASGDDGDDELRARQQQRADELAPLIRPDIAAGICDSELPPSERRRAAERYGRDVKKELEFELSARASLDERRHALRLSLAELRAASLPLAEIAERLCENEARLGEAERRYKGIVLALQRLEGAGTAIHGMLAPELTERVSSITRALTDGRYDRVGIDSDFTMHFSLASGARTVDDGYLSGGTKDAAYIALRLALTEQLCRNASPVMIYDESFCRIDDDRLVSLLGELARSGGDQTLILSSNDREIKALSAIGCGYSTAML